MRKTPARSARRLLPALLLLASLAPGCPAPPESTSVPVDLDRQCMPSRGEMACRGGLLCVRLFLPRVIGDMGLQDADNFTCHPACDDENPCGDLEHYTCYQPMAPPMPAVCVRKEVVARLQMDGGL